MASFDARRYGPVLGPLVDVDRRRPLGNGAAEQAPGDLRAKLTLESAFGHARVIDTNMARSALAGVWLVHDCLHESHELSQGIDTPTGSFWHAIMHRREGDFWNAKYWFRYVGAHEVFATLGMRAIECATARKLEDSTAKLVDGGRFDPAAFVDLVEAAEQGRRADALELCLDIQQVEWELLFDWCYRAAVK